MRIESSLNEMRSPRIDSCARRAARPRAETSQRGGATLHLDTSHDVTPRARLGGAEGVPGMQAVLLEPRNKPVQVLSGRPPGQGTHGGCKKRLRTSLAHDPSAVAKNDLSKRLSEAVREIHSGSKISFCIKNKQEP